MTYQTNPHQNFESTKAVGLSRRTLASRGMTVLLVALGLFCFQPGAFAQAKPGTEQGDSIAERVETQETSSSDQDDLVKEIAEAAKKAGQDHPNDADAVKKAVKEKLDDIRDRKSHKDAAGKNRPGGANAEEIREWVKNLKKELLKEKLVSTAAAPGVGPGQDQGDKIAELVETEETKSSDQDDLVEEISDAAKKAGEENPNDPQKVKDAVKAKLDDIRDRQSHKDRAGKNRPGGKRNSDIEEWVKKLKKALMGETLISVMPPSGSRILLTGTVIENQPATLSVVDATGAVLEGVVVEVAGERRTSDEYGRVIFTAAAGAATLAALLPELIDGSPVEAVVASFDGAVLPAVPVLNPLPSHVVPGDVVTINGSGFDGVAPGNIVLIDGVEVPVLASSPNQIVVEVPQDTPYGRHDVSVETENGVSEPRSMAAIGIRLESTDTALVRGKKGKGFIVVEGADEPVTIEVTNLSPQTVSLSDGDAVTIRTSGGRENRAKIQFRANNPGAFRITAKVAAEGR